MKEIVAEGLSVYRVDVHRLRELRPDFILTQTQCAVCAVTARLGCCSPLLGGKTTDRPFFRAENNLDEVWADIRASVGLWMLRRGLTG